jgi:hypothetical protein
VKEEFGFWEFSGLNEIIILLLFGIYHELLSHIGRLRSPIFFSTPLSFRSGEYADIKNPRLASG